MALAQGATTKLPTREYTKLALKASRADALKAEVERLMDAAVAARKEWQNVDVARLAAEAERDRLAEALRWGIARLEVDDGMTPKEQARTASRFRTDLEGITSA